MCSHLFVESWTNIAADAFEKLEAELKDAPADEKLRFAEKVMTQSTKPLFSFSSLLLPATAPQALVQRKLVGSSIQWNVSKNLA